MNWIHAVDNYIPKLQIILEHNSNLLNRLQRLVSDQLYIIGHRSQTNPDVILILQVSARARALLGMNNLD
jgi:hypothetical protein